MPHKFTLANDDGSYTQTLAVASDAQPGDAAPSVILTFTNLAEHHTYTLSCDNGDSTYTVFENVHYEQLHLQTQDSGAGSDPPSSAAGADPSGATGSS
jgi:hypothetical protein